MVALCFSILWKKETSALFCLPTRLSEQTLFFFSRGAWTGGQRREAIAVSSVALKTAEALGQWAEVSPHFPFAAGKQVPCVARGDAGAGRCLCVAKAPWAGSLRLCSWKLLDAVFWSCPDIGLVWMVSFSVCTWRRVSEMGAITAALPRPELLWEPD